VRLTDAGGTFALHRTTEHWSQRAICFLRRPNWQFWSLAPGAARSIRAEPSGRNGDSCTAHPRPVPQREIPCRAVNPNCTTQALASERYSIINITRQGLTGSTRASTTQVGRSRHAHTQAITQQQSRAWWSNKGPNFGALALVEGSAWPSIYSMLQLAGGALSTLDPHTPRGAGDGGPIVVEESGFAGSLDGRPKTEVPQNEFPLPTSSPTACIWGVVSSQHLTSKRQRSQKVCLCVRVCQPFCRWARVSPRRPELPRSSRENKCISTMALMGSWTSIKCHLIHHERGN